VQSVAVTDGRAIIELALTTPFCPLVDVMEHRDCGRKRVLGARASPPACRDCGRKRVLGARASPPARRDCERKRILGARASPPACGDC
jgi:hypothetical protein